MIVRFSFCQIVVLALSFAAVASTCSAFVAPRPGTASATSLDAGLGDLFDSVKQRIDDEANDFFYKRLGNGEVFNGKRKVNPTQEGEYNGFGISSHQKIKEREARKEYMLEQRRAEKEEYMALNNIKRK